MHKFKTSFITVAAISLFLSAVMPIFPNQVLPEELETKEAAASSMGPAVQARVRDIGCREQERTGYPVGPYTGVSRVTDSNAKDIDCALINLIANDVSTTNPVQSIYANDFRLGITLAESEGGCTRSQGSVAWTNWASEGTPNSATTFNSGLTYGTGGMVAADCVNIWFESRGMPEGKAIRNMQFGISVGGGGMQYTPTATSGGGWSQPSATGDFTSGEVSIITTVIDVPDDAQYVSTTIPQVETATYPTGNPAGGTMGNLPVNSAQNYNIVMKNKGGTWDTDTLLSRNLASASPTPPGNNCDGWVPNGPGQTCIENLLMTSSKYRLKRIDSSASVQTTAGDLPYNRTVQNTWESREIIDYDCPPPPPPEPCQGEELKINNRDSDSSPLALILKQANAAEEIPCGGPLEPPICTEIPTGVYEKVGPFISPVEDIAYDQNATFPISVTATTAGTYELRFRMVRVSGNTQFGETMIISVRAGNPWSFTCGVNQIVPRGTPANYTMQATVPGGFTTNINVTMEGNPAGPTLQTSPVVLSAGSVPAYQGTAVVPTESLVPNQTYVLTFTATDGTNSAQCQANLFTTPDTVEVYLQFNNSDGPAQPTPANGSTGTLSWTTLNANTCTGSMQQGADTSSPAWTGPQAPANTVAQTFNVNGMQTNSTYEFKLSCVSTYGTPAEDTVVVNVGPPNQPTAELLCLGANSGKGEEPGPGPCTVPYMGAAELTWSSTYANSCSISPGAWPTTTSGSGATSNLTSDITYTLSCMGAVGTTPATSEVEVTVESAPSFNVTCTPSTISIPQGSTTAFNLSTEGVDGFNSPVTWSVADLEPSGPNPPTISFLNNGLEPDATTTARISTTTSTTSDVYTINFAANGSSVNRSCNVELIITTVSAPNPPTNVQASNAICGQIGLTWNPPTGGQNPEGYRVFRRVNNSGNPWTQIGGNIPFGTNSYTDTTAVVGTFYNYGVSAYIGGSSSVVAEAIPASITPTACSANISTSDKDMIGYKNDPSQPSIPSQPPAPILCNHNPNGLDVFRLPNNAAFQTGKIATFRIAICNTGNVGLTDLTVNDVMTNLTSPTSFNYSGCTTTTQTSTGPNTMTFNLGDLAVGGTCIITYDAVITAPTGPSAVYRFQNRGNITAQSQQGRLTHSAYTLPYTFVINSGPPTRTED